MGMNFLGLGFNFGSQDKGLAKSIKTTSSGLADISKSVIGIGAASAKMAFKPPNVGAAANQFLSLASDVKLTTTQLEAFGVQASKASSAGLAGLNKTGQEMKKLKSIVSSTAFSMNTDVGAVTKSMVALEQAGYDTTKSFAGFKSFKEFQKVMEVTGADATSTAAAMRRLEAQYKFNSKEVGTLMQKNMALGKRMNIGREAMQGFGKTVNFLADNAQALGKDFDKVDMERYVLGTTKMQGALVAAGASAADASQSVQLMNQMLLGGQKGMTAIFAGLEKDMQPSMNALIEHFGGVDKMFELMKKSPDEFAAKMASSMEDVRKVTGDDKVFNRFRLQMEGTFGKGMMAGVDKGGKVMQKALDKANKPLGDTSSAFSDTAKAYEDGRTAAERFAIAQDRLLTRMKKIQGVMSDQEYLKKYKTNTDALYKSLNKTAKKGGPLGKMTTMLIEMRTKGIGGALAAQSKWGLAIAELGNQFGPILKALPGIAAAFAALASPITLVAGAIGGLFFVFKDLEKGDKSIVRPWIKKLKKEAPKILEAVKNAFTKALSIIGDVIQYVVEKIDFNKVGQVLGSILDKAVQVAIKILAAAIKLTEKLIIWLGNVNWGAVGKKLGYYFAQIGVMAIEALWKVIKNLPQIILKALDGIRDAILGIFDGIRDFLVKKFPSAAKPIAFIIEMFKAWYRIIFAIYKFVVKVVVGAFRIAFKAIKAVIEGVVWAVKKVWSGIKAIGGAIKKVGGWVKSGISAVGGVFSSIGSGIKSLFGGGGSSMSSLVKKAMEKAKSDAKKDTKSLQEIMEEARAKAQKAMDKATAGAIKNVNEITKDTRQGVKDAFDELIKSGKKVVTVEGYVIDASKSVTQYVRTAKGEVTKMVYEANKLRFAQIKADGFKEASDAIREFRKESDFLLKNENYSAEKMDEYFKRRKEAEKAYFDQHGIGMTEAANAHDYISKQMALEKSLIDGMSSASEGYRKALMANQDQLATNLAMEYKRVRQMQLAGEITNKQASEMYKQIDIQITKSREMAKDVGDIIEGNFDKLLSDMERKTAKGKATAARLAKVYTDNIRGTYENAVKGIPEASQEVKREMKSIYDDLAKTHEGQLRLILQNEKLNATERALEIDKLNKEIEGKQNALTKALRDNNEALLAGAQDDTLRTIKSISDGFKKMSDETKVKTAEAAGEIQKTMGVSADEAARMVGTISNLKPHKFKKNMKIIKGEFKLFLKSVTDESKSMMDQGATYINTFWKTAQEGWNQQTLLVKKWADDSRIHIQQYWTDVITEAGRALTGFLGLANRVQAQLKATASSFNIMNLLASPAQIRSWAYMVTGSLAAAIRGGSISRAMSDAYEAALTNPAAASPDTGGDSGSGGRRSSAASRSIKEAINRPAWVNSTANVTNSQLIAMREELQNLAAAMKKMAEDPPAPATGSGNPRTRRKR